LPAIRFLSPLALRSELGTIIGRAIDGIAPNRLFAFNRTFVFRYRFFLEQKNPAPSTINVTLAAVRRLAYEDE